MPTNNAVRMPRVVQRSASWALTQLETAVRQQVDAALARTTDSFGGLSLRGYWLLEAISGNSFSQRELCDLLGIDRSDMVRLIDTLEEANLVERTRDMKDRRRQLIMITETGNSLRQNLRRNIRRAEGNAVAAMDDAVLEAVADLLEEQVDDEPEDAPETAAEKDDAPAENAEVQPASQADSEQDEKQDEKQDDKKSKKKKKKKKKKGGK
ncbi:MULTISPECIES: MarR family winged helix-turn-helix transcriptional regulator [unclassified Corynebacterium]|uniref:MarR family winged helix-turn-helix transcriptional regulator n=1 Tax=unclassified Corynebacterium TaxID=2624378 RepID=UPI0030969E77